MRFVSCRLSRPWFKKKNWTEALADNARGDQLALMKRDVAERLKAGQDPSSMFRGNGLPGVHRIELKLHNVDQLFNTMDPSPFHEKDLDHDAEEFIVSWAEEYHYKEDIELVVHLEESSTRRNECQLVNDAIHHYFAYRARLNRLEFNRLMQQGRTTLMVGLSFLLVCLGGKELLIMKKAGALTDFLS